MSNAPVDQVIDSRPSSQNVRDQLVAEARGFLLAGKILHVRIFHVLAGSPGSTPSSPLTNVRGSISDAVGKGSAAQSSLGFRVHATDELDNDFSLFVSRQKAEYLVAAQRKPDEAAALLSLEQMGNSILDHLDIIGNRNRDIGKLTCREPEIRITKRTRAVPTQSAESKQRNPHLAGRQNDQRAVRAKKNALKAMAAIASSHEQVGLVSQENGELQELHQAPSRRSRKASDDSLLHRMAFSNDKSTWRANLTTSVEEEQQTTANSTTSTLPVAVARSNTSSATSVGPKRMIPERKHKHKDLYERRAKERKQRLLITRTQSSSNIMDMRLQSPQGIPLASLTVEEGMGEEDDQAKLIGSKDIRARFNAAVRNAYAVRTFLGVKSPVETEQFLRRRTAGRGERRVIKGFEAFSDFPGMGVEITHERPEGRYSVDESDPMMQEKLRILTQAAQRSSLVRDKDGNLVRRANSSRANSLRRVTNPDVPGLVASSSAPVIGIIISAPLDSTYDGADCLQKDDVNEQIQTPTTSSSTDRQSGSVGNSLTSEVVPEFASNNDGELKDKQTQESKMPDPEVVFEPGLPVAEASQANADDCNDATRVIVQQQIDLEQFTSPVNTSSSSLGIDYALKAIETAPLETPKKRLSPLLTTPRRQMCWNESKVTAVDTESSMEPSIASEKVPTSDLRSRPKSASDAIPPRIVPLELSPQDTKENALKPEVAAQESDNYTSSRFVNTKEGKIGEEIAPADTKDDDNDHSQSQCVGEDRISRMSSEQGTEKLSLDHVATAMVRYPQELSNAASVLMVGCTPNEVHSMNLLIEYPAMLTVSGPTDKECQFSVAPQLSDDSLYQSCSSEKVPHENHFELGNKITEQNLDEGGGKPTTNPSHRSEPNDNMSAIATAPSAITSSSPGSPPRLPKPALQQKHLAESRIGSTTNDKSAKQFSMSPSSTQRGGPLLPRDPFQSPAKRLSSVLRAQNSSPLDDHKHGGRRKSVVKAVLPQLSTILTSDATISTDSANSSSSSQGKPNGGGSSGPVQPKRRRSVSKSLALVPSAYHKTWSKWVDGKGLVEKINCLQLEEHVLSDPHNGAALVKLGLRYAKWSATSLAGILLLEHASALHESAPRTHDFWNSMGNAHLDVFLRNRKFLPAAIFHLDRCIKSLTRAFAFMESMADPLLLLRFALCLFWHQEPGHLERADEIFRQLFTKFASFCDRDRASLYFLRFQVLHRLGTYTEATNCIDKVIVTVLSDTAPPRGLIAQHGRKLAAHTPIYDLSDYWMMKMQSQQASGDYVQATSTFSQILEAKGLLQDGSLTDDQYFELWYGIAEKCFLLEDYALASEYYPIALSFAKDSYLLAAIHYHLGLCFQALGNDQRCTAEFKRARNLNRHVRPPVSVAELRGDYSEQFSDLLQKPVRQVIEEVRVNLYDRAVRQLQRIFRQKHPSHKSMKETELTSEDSSDVKMPSIVARKFSGSPNRVRSASESPRQSDLNSTNDGGIESMEPIQESDGDLVAKRLAEFEAKKRLALEQIESLRCNPVKDPRFPNFSSLPGIRASTQSELLSPEKDRPEMRRLRSMATYNHVRLCAWVLS